MKKGGLIDRWSVSPEPRNCIFHESRRRAPELASLAVKARSGSGGGWPFSQMAGIERWTFRPVRSVSWLHRPPGFGSLSVPIRRDSLASSRPSHPQPVGRGCPKGPAEVVSYVTHCNQGRRMRGGGAAANLPHARTARRTGQLFVGRACRRPPAFTGGGGGGGGGSSARRRKAADPATRSRRPSGAGFAPAPFRRPCDYGGG